MHDQPWLRMICPCENNYYYTQKNAFKEITWAKVNVFSLTKSRPRKIQMFRPANWNHTFVESWVAFFHIYLTQSVLAPLKCLTTNMESAEIDRKWLTEKKKKKKKKQTKNRCFDSQTDKWAAAGSKKFKVANEVVWLNKIWRSRCASALV